MARDRKLENIGLFIKELDAQAAAVKAEKDNMAERQKSLESKANNLRKYAAYALRGEKFSTPKVAFSYRKSEVVDIAADAKIPEEFIKTKIEKAPDKAALKKAMKDGAEFEGITLVTKQNLQIK